MANVGGEDGGGKEEKTEGKGGLHGGLGLMGRGKGGKGERGEGRKGGLINYSPQFSGKTNCGEWSGKS